MCCEDISVNFPACLIWSFYKHASHLYRYLKAALKSGRAVVIILPIQPPLPQLFLIPLTQCPRASSMTQSLLYHLDSPVPSGAVCDYYIWDIWGGKCLLLQEAKQIRAALDHFPVLRETAPPIWAREATFDHDFV